MQEKPVELTREELYEKVWSKPVSHLAKDFGISDVGLTKICKRHSIPTPPLGYWAKVRAGQRVRKTRLPSLDSDEGATITIGTKDTETVGNRKQDSLPEEFQAMVIEAVERMATFTPDDLSPRSHPLITWASRSFKKPSETYTGILVPSDRGCLNIQVTKQTLVRALAFLNTMFKLAEACGHSIAVTETGCATLDILGGKMELGLKERVKREEKIKANDPKIHNRLMLSYVDANSASKYTYKEYSYVPTGELCLVVKSPEFYMSDRRWCDTKTTTIEEKLTKILPGLVRFAARSQLKREERDEWHRQRVLEEKERIERQRLLQEKKRLIEEENQRVQTLMEEAERWQKSNLLRGYIQAKRQQAIEMDVVIVTESELGGWLEWAQGQADRLDPLAISPPSILDENIRTHPFL